MGISVNGVDLDWKSREVLEAVVEMDGRATTGEVKEYTGLDTNQVVLYRFGKLEDAGVVRVDELEDWDRELRAPRVAVLTEEGEELVVDGELEFEVRPGDEDLTMDERVLRVEQQLDRMRDTYTEVKRRIVEIEGELEDHDEDLDDLAEDIEGVKRFLSERLE